MKPAIIIYRLIRRVQQRNRVVGRSSTSGLSLAESHFLLELDARPQLGIGELAAVLKLDQSFTSRLAQSLAKHKLLTLSRDPEDSRRKRLALTAAGRATIRKIDENANANYRSMVVDLAQADEQRVVWLFRTISDGYGLPAAAPRTTEPPYRAEQRRLTRACGLLAESVFGSSLSTTVWHVLSEVVLSPVSPQPGELAILLSLANNSLSSIVTAMEKKGYLGKAPHRGDGRSIELRALAAGERLYADVEKSAAAQIEKALQSVPAQKIKEAVAAFQHFINDSGDGLPPLARHLTVTSAQSDEDRRAARGFIARSLVRESWEQWLPEHFVSSSNDCYLLHEGQTLLAVVEFDRSRVMIKSCGWSDSVTPWSLTAFIASTLLRGFEGQRTLSGCAREFEPLRDFLSL